MGHSQGVGYQAGLPPGVVNVVPGYGATAGAALVSAPEIVKVDVTGGTTTGQTIGAIAGAQAKHFCAELGGNAPVMVFEDVEVQTAVNGVAFAAFVAAGQTCVSAKRILIQESIYEEFVAALVAKASNLRLGNPFDMETSMGPVVSKLQQESILAHIERAVSAGATVLTGGGAPTCSEMGLCKIPPLLFGSGAGASLATRPWENLGLHKKTSQAYGSLASLSRLFSFWFF